MIAWLKQRWRRPGWNEGVVLLAAFAFCLSLWIFVEMADDALEGQFADTEAKIMRSFRQPNDLGKVIGPEWTLETARDVTAMGGATVLSTISVFVIGHLLLRRAYATSALVFAAILGGLILNLALKSMFHRPRPEIVPHLMIETSASFPSGHAMLSSIAYITLGALLARTTARRREKIYLISLSLFTSGIIGVSRVYLGVHYPTDVLAGWSAGTAWALLCWFVARWLQNRGKLERLYAPETEIEKT